MNKKLFSLMACCILLAACASPAAFEVSPETQKVVSSSPVQYLNTWGTLEIPLPDGIKMSSDTGSKMDFDVFYFTPKKEKGGGLLVYVGHHPNSRKEKSESPPEPVSLNVMGKTAEGNRLYYDGKSVIEIITEGGKNDALLHITLTEGVNQDVFSAMLEQMRITDSKKQ